MDKEFIERVKKVLQSPKSNLHELNQVHIQIYNKPINIKCGDCIRDAVFLLNSWLKKNGEEKVNVSDVEVIKEINLFVQVYQSIDLDRQKELDYCLAMNKANEAITRVIEVHDRLTYNELFKLTEQYPDCINIIANSDIYFNETILYTRFMKKHQVYALSRWDKVGNKCKLFDRADSQDVWIFNGVARQVNYGSFTLGVPGCDNRIAYELKQAGYEVLNPSKTIHAIHVHETNMRTYDGSNRISEPFLLIQPHFL